MATTLAEKLAELDALAAQLTEAEGLVNALPPSPRREKTIARLRKARVRTIKVRTLLATPPNGVPSPTVAKIDVQSSGADAALAALRASRPWRRP